MRIGFVLSQPFGRSIGTDVRIRGLLEGLSHLEVEIHIITPFVENISFENQNISVHKIPSLSTKLKISNYTYALSRKFVNNPFLFRNVICRKSLLLNNARSFGRGIYEIARRLDLDVIQAEQQIASIACTRNKEKLNVPVVVDFHGIWAEEMVASNVINYDDGCFQTLFDLEREVACSADIVTVVSEEMKNYVVSSFGASGDRVVLIPNAAFLKVDSDKVVEHPSKVIHSGTLHPWENVELFVESMPFVLKRYPSAKFYMTRRGAKLEKVKKLARSLNVSPEFVWFDSGAEFNEFLKSCDVGVISSTSHIARKMAYPAKLYDYLSVGLPIVANDIGAWTKIINENRVGVITDNTPEGFAGGILRLLENPKLLNECGRRGRELVRQELNYHKSAEKLYHLYEQLA